LVGVSVSGRLRCGRLRGSQPATIANLAVARQASRVVTRT
jgi:hypothetical protein